MVKEPGLKSRSHRALIAFPNKYAVDVMATGNTWGTICCEDIDSRIYDKEDDPMYGTVSYGTCTPCRVRVTMRPPA